MTNPLQGYDEETQQRIAQVRARLSAATPWKAEDCELCWDADDERLYAKQGAHLGDTLIALDDTYENSDKDWSLVANCQSDLAFLLSRVDSLESALRDAQKDAERVTWLEDQTWDDLGKLATLMDDERDCDTLRKAIDVARKRWADTGEST